MVFRQSIEHRKHWLEKRIQSLKYSSRFFLKTESSHWNEGNYMLRSILLINSSRLQWTGCVARPGRENMNKIMVTKHPTLERIHCKMILRRISGEKIMSETGLCRMANFRHWPC